MRIIRPTRLLKAKSFYTGTNMNERSRRALIRSGLIAGASTFAGAMLLPAAREKKKRRGRTRSFAS